MSMNGYVHIANGEGQRVIPKRRFKEEVTLAIQNAAAWLESMDADSDLSDEQLDIHKFVAKVMEEEEASIVNYIIRLSKKYQQ